MGSSSKKHKSRDRDRDQEDKKDKHRRKHRSKSGEPAEEANHKSSKKKHERSSRDEASPARREASDSERMDRRKEKKHKEKKRRHSGSDDSDSKSSPPKKAKEARSKAHSPSPVVTASATGDSSLSIEETNKLRAKLGLKPLQVGSSQGQGPSKPAPKRDRTESADSREAGEIDEERIKTEREQEGQTFWKEEKDFVHAPADNIGQLKEAEKLREKIHAIREKRRLEEKLLTTKGLGKESDDEDDSAMKFVEKLKKLEDEKALAKKRAQALEELDNEFGVGDLVDSEYVNVKNKAYTATNLRGMKVVHSQDRIAEGETVILTLQDKDVLAEDDDVLLNVNMVDEEKYEKNIENKKLRPELHGYDVFEDTYDPFKEKKILSKYDEEIDGEKKKSFVIGEDTTEIARRAKLRAQMQKANKILESIEAPTLKVASDFLSQEEMAFKKRTKKVRKVRKRLRADDLLFDNNTQNSARDLGARKKVSENSESTGIAKAEPVDMNIDMEIDDGPVSTSVDISDIKLEDEGDLDFQLALSKARKLKQKEKVKKLGCEKIAELVRSARARDEQISSNDRGKDSIVLHATAEFCRTLGDIPNFSSSDLYADEQMDFETEEAKAQREEEERGKWNAVQIDEAPIEIIHDSTEVEETPILEQEPELGVGLAGALKLAMKKGYVEQEKTKRQAVQKMKHLEAQNYSIEDKNYEDDRGSRRDMYSGPVVDFRDKSGYKPEVKLEYTDEEGRPISAKEAFRLLSHKFHGKGSGKNKIDKKRRKAEQEKLMQHMSSTDTPLGTLELLQERQKASHSAYVVLTGSKANQNTLLSKAKR